MLTQFERPADQSESAKDRRANIAYKLESEVSEGMTKEKAVETVVSLALSQVGYVEKASNSQLDDF